MVGLRQVLAMRPLRQADGVSVEVLPCQLTPNEGRMGSLLNKDYRLCSTCVYWGGQREFNSIPQIDVDPTSYGSCSQPLAPYGATGQPAMATANGCDHYELHPRLR